MSASEPRPALSRFPLLGALAVAGLLELVFDRVLARLIHTDFLQPRSSLTRAADLAAVFTFKLLGMLAVLTLGAGILRIVVLGSEMRPGARTSVPLLGFVFTALAAIGTLAPLSPNLSFHLQLSFLFLCLLLAMAALASHASPRIAAGVMLVEIAYVLRIIPGILYRFGRLPPHSVLTDDVLPVALIATIVLAAILLLPARGRGGVRLATVMTWLSAGAAAVIIRRDWDTAASVSTSAFGVELPTEPWGQLVCLGALAAVVYAIVRLLSVPGVHRLRGWGVLLIALAGLRLDDAPALALAAVGMLALTVSALRVDGKMLSRAEFEALVKGTAASLGAQQVTITGAHGSETARLHAPPQEGPPVAVVVQRRAHVVAGLEVVVGEPPPREPAFCIEHKEQRGLGPHPAGARVLTEDPAFDARFFVWDKHGAGAPLLDEPMRRKYEALVGGWLGVWPQRGVACRALEPPEGDDALPRLIALLREIAKQTA